MAKNTIGLDEVYIGNIAGDGGMSTTLSALGDTVRGTAVISSTDITTTDILIEESDTPILSINTGGNFTVAWSTHNVDPETLVKLFGGTVVTVGGAKRWNAPSVIPSIEQSVRMVSKNGYQADMPRVQLRATLAMNFQRESAGQINISGTVLAPAKAGLEPLAMGAVEAFTPVG